MDVRAGGGRNRLGGFGIRDAYLATLNNGLRPDLNRAEQVIGKLTCLKQF
jgi:hypothetical protein